MKQCVFFTLILFAVVAVPVSAQTHTTILVVPFENITGAPADDWIGVGIAESLATELPARSRLRMVGVAPTVPTGTDATITLDATTREAAVLRGATHVIIGAFQHLGDRIRITGRLVHLTSGTVVRSSRVDGALTDLFALQDQLSGDLADMGPPTETTQVTSPELGPGEPSSATATVSDAVDTGGEVAATAMGRRVAGTVATGATTGVSNMGRLDGAPPPVAPDVVSRDGRGRATVRAIKLTEGIRLDGQLDEEVYHLVPPVTGFIQQIPDEGAPASERTEAWVMFDGSNLYLGARCYDSVPESAWVANEMRRDTAQLRQEDTFAVILDTFYDRRNGVAFYTNPLGALADFAITNEGNPNSDWNPVWDVRTGRFDGGWTVEMEIPFRSLRYRPEESPLWGFQLRRVIRRKNEGAYLSPLPISASRGSAIAGIFRLSDAGTLVGLEVPRTGRNIELKPYGIGGVTTDVNAIPPMDQVRDGDIGFDVKYGITQNLTADFTYNTDFAQVEVDEQQVNLTRFSLFFPEKREFFLEGRGIFDFARGGVGGGGGRRGGFFGGGNTPSIFYSRRIGLEAGQVVPIIAGGRVTGKVGPFDVGAINIQTDAEEISQSEPTNFTIVRLKRDILRRSSVGAILTNRSVSRVGVGSSQTFGVDGTFSFYDNVSFLGYAAKTETPGLSARDTSYQTRFTYGGDRYGFEADHLLVGDNFVPEVGFIRRDNFRRTYTYGRFSPRPRSLNRIRQFRFEGSIDYILTADTHLLETRQNQLNVQTELENSDRIALTVNDNYELLHVPFSPGGGVTLPVGGYDFRDMELSYSLGQQRRYSGQVSLLTGGYFNGDITTIRFSRARVSFTNQLSLEPSLSVNWIDTPHGSLRTDLVVTRVNYTFSPRMFFSGLVQYNSARDTLTSNLRLRWEYRPGSELFVVYTEEQDTDPLRPDRYTELRNRGFVVKFNRLFRF